MNNTVLERFPPEQPPETNAGAPEARPASFSELRAAFRTGVMAEPPADLWARPQAYRREVLHSEGKLAAHAWRAKLKEAIGSPPSLVPEPRPKSAFSNHRALFQVRHSAAHLAARTTGLALFGQEREADRYTTLMHCRDAAFTACRLSKEELRK